MKTSNSYYAIIDTRFTKYRPALVTHIYHDYGTAVRALRLISERLESVRLEPTDEIYDTITGKVVIWIDTVIMMEGGA
tara:strand:+ start:2217 stop:2450 length:234 start_codon:yes stop_codon:yes gene_type:complete